jgi:hypothetical protein
MRTTVPAVRGVLSICVGLRHRIDKEEAADMRFHCWDITRRLAAAVLLTVPLAACAGKSYQVSGIASVGVYGTATDFLTQRGYEILPEPMLGPVAVLERTDNGRVERMSVFEQYRESQRALEGGGALTTSWVTVSLKVEAYELEPDGRRRRVAPSAVARAHADSLLILLRASGRG